MKVGLSFFISKTAAKFIDTLRFLKSVTHFYRLSGFEFVQVQLEKQRRTNTNSDNTRKTVRYNSVNVLSGLLVCKECGKNYRRITRKDGEVVWRCADRVENSKQASCQNLHTVSDTEIKQAICDYLGIKYFDEGTVKEGIYSIKIGSDNIEFVNPMDRLFSVSM